MSVCAISPVSRLRFKGNKGGISVGLWKHNLDERQQRSYTTYMYELKDTKEHPEFESVTEYNTPWESLIASDFSIFYMHSKLSAFGTPKFATPDDSYHFWNTVFGAQKRKEKKVLYMSMCNGEVDVSKIEDAEKALDMISEPCKQDSNIKVVFSKPGVLHLSSDLNILAKQKKSQLGQFIVGYVKTKDPVGTVDVVNEALKGEKDPNGKTVTLVCRTPKFSTSYNLEQIKMMYSGRKKGDTSTVLKPRDDAPVNDVMVAQILGIIHTKGDKDCDLTDMMKHMNEGDSSNMKKDLVQVMKCMKAYD